MKLRRVLLLLFFLSGATALVYQVLWLRLLTLVFGATTAAVGTVLTSFMVGLAVGGMWFGRLADRAERPLRLYAMLELGIALSALLLPHALRSLDSLYPALYASAQTRPWILPLVRGVFSSLLLVIPCTLMGGTLPVLVRFAARVPETFGRHFGWIYGMNTLGAAAGSLAAGLFLIGHLGVASTNALAAATNAALAVSFFLLDRYFVPGATRPKTAATREEPTPFAFTEKLVVGVSVLSGGTILGLEVLWTRALVHALWSTTHTFAIILSTVLLGLTGGSLLASRWALPKETNMGPPLLGRIAIVELAFAASLVLTMPLLGQLVFVYFFYYRAIGFLGLLAPKFLTVALLLFLPATVAGMLFPITVQVLSRRMPTMGGSLGRLYLLNALASAGGALLFSFVLIPYVGVTESYQAVIIVHLVAAAVFGYYAFRKTRWLFAPAAVMIVAVVTLKAIDRPDVFGDPIFYGPGLGLKLLENRETADATYSVYEQTQSGERQLYINGYLAADNLNRASYMRMMAHLPLLLHPDPHRVLVIAFGTGNTAGAASLHHVDEIDIVDTSREVYRLAPFFAATNHDVLSDPRARVVVADGRDYIQSTQQTYDVITSEPMPPKFAGMVNFYTSEYYQAARSKLTPEGVICQWLPFHQMSLEDARIVSRTFLEAFPHSSLWIVGGHGILVGSKAELHPNAETLAKGFRNPAVAQSLQLSNLNSPEDILCSEALDSEGLRLFAGSAPVMSDDRPYLEFSGDQYMYIRQVGPTLRLIEELRERLRSDKSVGSSTLHRVPPSHAPS
jgi:spermidine synthase